MERYMDTEPSIHERLTQAVEHYEMPDLARELLAGQKMVLLCGITSAGKDTIAGEIIRDGGYELVISHTTREPRKNHGELEKDGAHYHFIDEPQMLNMVTAQNFIEVKPVHHDFYGTSINSVTSIIQKGNTPIFVIDVQGMQELVDAFPNLEPIFVLPPSLTEWQRRLDSRGEMDDATKRKRFKSAVKEIGRAINNPNFKLLINDSSVDSASIVRAGYVGRDHHAVDVADNLKQQIEKNIN